MRPIAALLLTLRQRWFGQISVGAGRPLSTSGRSSMVPDTPSPGQVPSSTRKRWRLISFGPTRVGMQIASYEAKAWIAHLPRRTAP
jgi:hypothetical protein